MQLRSHWWGMRFWKLLGKSTGMGLLFLLYCISDALFPSHFLLLWSEYSFQTQNRLKTLLRHQFLKRRVARSICLWPMDLIVQMSEKLLLISIRMILKCFGRQCLSKGIWRREGRGEKNRKCFHNKGYRSWKDCGKVSLKLLYLRARVLVGELTAEPRLLLSQGGAGAQQCALFQHYPCGTAAVAAIGFFHHYVSFLRLHSLFSSQRKKMRRASFCPPPEVCTWNIHEVRNTVWQCSHTPPSRQRLLVKFNEQQPLAEPPRAVSPTMLLQHLGGTRPAPLPAGPGGWSSSGCGRAGLWGELVALCTMMQGRFLCWLIGKAHVVFFLFVCFSLLSTVRIHGLKWYPEQVPLCCLLGRMSDLCFSDTAGAMGMQVDPSHSCSFLGLWWCLRRARLCFVLVYVMQL